MYLSPCLCPFLRPVATIVDTLAGALADILDYEDKGSLQSLPNKSPCFCPAPCVHQARLQMDSFHL